MNLLYDVLPGELANWEPEPESWEWEGPMRRCSVCGGDRDVEPVDVGYGCRNVRACLARFKAKQTPHAAKVAAVAA